VFPSQYTCFNYKDTTPFREDPCCALRAATHDCCEAADLPINFTAPISSTIQEDNLTSECSSGECAKFV
jgi:hypothetical protein